jgi:hypothetical protein
MVQSCELQVAHKQTAPITQKNYSDFGEYVTCTRLRKMYGMFLLNEPSHRGNRWNKRWNIFWSLLEQSCQFRFSLVVIMLMIKELDGRHQGKRSNNQMVHDKIFGCTCHNHIQPLSHVRDSLRVTQSFSTPESPSKKKNIAYYIAINLWGRTIQRTWQQKKQ